MPEEIVPGQTYIPPEGRKDPRVAAWWQESPFTRARKHLFMSQETLEQDLLIMFGSFSLEALQTCVANHYDVLPLIQNIAAFGGGTFDRAIEKVAKAVMRNNTWRMFDYLRGERGEGPVKLREVIRRAYPEKAAIFDAQDGWDWINATTWSCCRWIYEWAQPRGSFWYPKPPLVDLLVPVPPGIVTFKGPR